MGGIKNFGATNFRLALFYLIIILAKSFVAGYESTKLCQMTLTFSTPVKSFSISSNALIEMPAFKCQCMPYNDAAILDAAVVLAE